MLDQCKKFIKFNNIINEAAESFSLNDKLVTFKYTGINDILKYSKNNGRYNNLADYLKLFSKEKENMIEIDSVIYRYLNEPYMKEDVLLDIKNNGIENGYIYSCKQIKNQLDIKDIYTDGLSFYTIKDGKKMDLREITKGLYR